MKQNRIITNNGGRESIAVNINNRLRIIALLGCIALVQACRIDVILPPPDYHFILVNKTNTTVMVISEMKALTGADKTVTGVIKPGGELELLNFELRNIPIDNYDATFYELLSGEFVSVYLPGRASPVKTWMHENRTAGGRQLFKRTSKSSINVQPLDLYSETRSVYITFDIIPEDIVYIRRN